MEKIFLTAALLFLYSSLFSQDTTTPTEFNFDFEKLVSGEELPTDWFRWGSEQFELIPDSTTKHSGNVSMLIQPKSEDIESSFGCIAYKIPAQYKAKNIELRAYMKFEDVDKPIGLMIRVDGKSGVLSFDNMQKRGIKGTSDWNQYAVKVSYPDHAQNIFIGAILSGKGKLWVDDFEVLLDGKDIREAKIVEPELLKADKDLEFDKGSNITLNNLKDQEETRLYNLGLIWGFLKYYHPAVAAGEYNWDYELFRILPELADLKGEEWDARLQSWITNLGELKEGKEPEYNDEVIIYPDLDWIENSGFSSDLVAALQKVKTAKRTGKHYYIELARSIQNPVFLNENRYKEMSFSDAGFRLLALYKYWNMIQYFFPYKHLIEGDWKLVLAESVPKFIEADNELAYKLNMLELIGKIHDTHANIWGADSTLTAFKGERYAPLKTRFIGDKAVVTGFYNEELAKETGLKIGDIITAVDGKPVDALIKEKLKYYPASNYVTKLRGISRDLLRSNTETIAVEYTSGQNAKSATLKTYLPEKLDLRLTDAKPDTCFSYLEPDIAYIYPGNIDAKHISDFMEEIQDTKGLVIDLRCYPSNFIVFTLGRHLMPEKTEFVKFTHGSIEQPGLFSIQKHISVGIKNKDYYKGKIVILIDETTQSQAEYTTMAYRVAPNATVIGSQTAGADGNVSPFYLPGGVYSLISGIGVYYPDGTETQRIGIVPDIEVKPTIQGIRDNRDEVLESAINLIQENN